MLGARIAALRREAGLSQSELAVRLGVSASAVGMYEQGRREPAADMLVMLARELGVSTDYLLTGHAAGPAELASVEQMLVSRLAAAQERCGKAQRPLSREELAVLFAALLTQP